MVIKRVPYYLLRLLPALLLVVVFIRFDSLMDGRSISEALYVICLSAAIGLVLVAIVISRKKPLTLKLNFLDGFVLLFTGYVLIRGLFTKHFSPANPWFVVVFVLAGIYFLLKILLQLELNKQRRTLMYVFIWGFLIMGLIQAVYGLLQLYGLLVSHNSHFTLTGSFGNPNFLAGYLAVIIPIAAGTYLYSGRKNIPWSLKYTSAATFLVCFLALTATHARAAWLATVVSTGFVVICRYHLWSRFSGIINTPVKKVVCIFSGLILLAVLCAGLYRLKPNSAYGRLFIWKVTTTRMVPMYLLYGMGFNKFKTNYNNQQAEYFASGVGKAREKWIAGNIKHTHNEYLQILSEFGIVGLLLFGSMLIALFSRWNQRTAARKKEVQDRQWISQIMTASLLSGAVLAFFSFPFHILPTVIILVITGAFRSAMKPSRIYLTIPINKKWLQTAFAIFLIIFSAAGFYYSHQKFNQYRRWNAAVQAGFMDQPQQADSLFTGLHSPLKTNGKFMFTWGSYEARMGNCPKALRLLEQAREEYDGPHLYLLLGACYRQTGHFKKAEKNIKHAIWMQPQKMYPRYLLTKLYRKKGYQEKAVHEARQLLQMKQKIPTPAGRQIKQKMQAMIRNVSER